MIFLTQIDTKKYASKWLNNFCHRLIKDIKSSKSFSANYKKNMNEEMNNIQYLLKAGE